MILYVNVKPNSEEERIEKISDNEYKIWLKEKAKDGKANKALIKLICREFNTNYKNIKVKGLASRRKMIEIIE